MDSKELQELDKTIGDLLKSELEKVKQSGDTKIKLACLNLAMKWRKHLQEGAAMGMGSAIGEDNEEQEEAEDNEIQELLDDKEE